MKQQFGLAAIGTMFSRFTLGYSTMLAAKYQHHRLLHCTFGAPQAFFDTVPKGRILSRFSADLDIVDVKFPDSLRQYLETVFRVGHSYFVSFQSLALNMCANVNMFA